MEAPIYEYVLTKPDFLHAQKLFRSHRKWSAVAYWFWIWLLPGIGALLALAAVYAWATHNSILLAPLAPAAGGGLWIAIFIPLTRWFQLRKAWRNSVPKALEGKPVTLQFDDEQIISTIPGRSEGRFFWSAILDFIEDDRLALLYVREKLFLYIPKAALPDSAWQRMRELTPKERRRLN